MSKPRRQMRLSEMAVSERALALLGATDPRAMLRVARHVQSEWARTARKPGHAVVLDLEVGPALCSAVLGGHGRIRAVIVTRLEACVMQARAYNPTAPGTVSPLRRLAAR